MRRFVIAAGLLASSVAGQGITAVVCLTSTAWMNNAQGQTPCQVAADLANECFSGGFTVEILAGPTYPALSCTNLNTCECNAVYYNLLMACSVCQGDQVVGWSAFTGGCPTAYLDPTGFPNSIPLGTSVPTWAYIDPRPLGLFSASQAQAYADSASVSLTPGVSPSATSTSTTTTAISTISVDSNSQSTSTASPSSNSSKSSPIGAIVGGIVGGLAVIVLCVIALLLYNRGKNKPATDHHIPAPAPAWEANAKPLPPDFPAYSGAQNSNLGYQGYQGPAPGFATSAPLPPGAYMGAGGVPVANDGQLGGPSEGPYRPYSVADSSIATPRPTSASPLLMTSYLSSSSQGGQQYNPAPGFHVQNPAGAREEMGEAGSPPPVYQTQTQGYYGHPQ